MELGAEDPLGLLLHFLDYVVSQAGSEVGAAVVDFVVGVPIGAQLSQQARGNAGGLPWIGNDVGEAAGEPGYADRLVDVELPLRVVDGVGVADVYGCRLPFGAVGKAALRVRGIDELPGDSGEDMALIVQFSPAGSFAVENLGQEDVLATKRLAALHGGDSSRLGRIPQHVVADSGQPLLFQTALDLRYGFADVGIPAIDVALVERFASGAPSVGLSYHAADKLGEGDLRAGVVQHHQHIGEWAVPTLHESGFGDYPSHGREW